jgi:hypothetical protein
VRQLRSLRRAARAEELTAEEIAKVRTVQGPPPGVVRAATLMSWIASASFAAVGAVVLLSASGGVAGDSGRY